MSKYTIVLEKNGKVEAWTALTDLCEAHSLSYNYLKRKEFPFSYKGFNFTKCLNGKKVIDELDALEAVKERTLFSIGVLTDIIDLRSLKAKTESKEWRLSSIGDRYRAQTESLTHLLDDFYATLNSLNDI